MREEGRRKASRVDGQSSCGGEHTQSVMELRGLQYFSASRSTQGVNRHPRRYSLGEGQVNNKAKGYQDSRYLMAYCRRARGVRLIRLRVINTLVVL